MRKLTIGAIAAFALFSGAASAQTAPSTANVVATCGTPNGASYTANQNRPVTQDTTGTLCTATGGGGTSAVNITQINGTTVLTGAGATGAGSQRTTVAVDSSTVAGSATLPAGTNNIGTIGSLEFNVATTPTVQNGSYAAGQSLGGLQTVSIGSTNGVTGILDQITIMSKGGLTGGIVAYVWQKNPSGTTCTDKTNFVVSATDNQNLVLPPTSITPALAVTAQDTSTYGSASNLVGNFANQSTNTDLYICLVNNATQTPATTSDLQFHIQGVKDMP